MIEKMREEIREIEARWRITQGWRKMSIRMGRGEKCGQGNLPISSCTTSTMWPLLCEEYNFKP